MRTRDEFPQFLTERGYARVAEVGVLRGEFSSRILAGWSGELTLIDPWRHLDGYRDISNGSDEEHERNLEATQQAVAGYAGVTLQRAMSIEAAEGYEDGYFDCVYIDANHSYTAALADIKAWWPKVRSGGALAGHDFLDGELMEGSFGVRRAVLEFFGREPDIVTQEKWPSWVVLKP